jgi:DNA polymerase delta subunit 2
MPHTCVLTPSVLGVVVALRGRADGPTFEVSAVCYPPVPPQRALAGIPTAGSVASAPAADDVYLALVSGLQVGAPGVDPLAATLLVEWLSGALGGRGEATLASRVARVVVAGDLLCALPPVNGHLDAKAASRHAGPLRDADVLLTQLAAALPVDLMPGRNDPSNAALPQQPLHACLLPQASRYATLGRVSNPHEFEMGGVRVLGTSGQNVDDLYRCTSVEDRLALLAATLEWGHLAPSAPDTLACYPFFDRDPFQIRDAPHLLFAGNQPEYGTAMHRAPAGAVTRLVLVPSFATTGTIVLVNLRTLAPHPVTFSTSPMA